MVTGSSSYSAPGSWSQRDQSSLAAGHLASKCGIYTRRLRAVSLSPASSLVPRHHRARALPGGGGEWSRKVLFTLSTPASSPATRYHRARRPPLRPARAGTIRLVICTDRPGPSPGRANTPARAGSRQCWPLPRALSIIYIYIIYIHI